MSSKLDSQLSREYKRLIQKANRRILSHLKEYEKQGMKVIPKEIVNDLKGIQHTSQFEGKITPLSRSLKGFDNKSLKKRINELKRALDNPNSVHYVPTVREYSNINQQKLLKALETSGIEIIEPLRDNVNKMSTVDLSRFWKRFTDRAIRASFLYSSEALLSERVEISKNLQSYVKTGLKLKKLRKIKK